MRLCLCLEQEPRLFQLSDVTGCLCLQEVPQFTQDDLTNEDVYIVDAYDEVSYTIAINHDSSYMLTGKECRSLCGLGAVPATMNAMKRSTWYAVLRRIGAYQLLFSGFSRASLRYSTQSVAGSEVPGCRRGPGWSGSRCHAHCARGGWSRATHVHC
jgi:hypothetical protein